MQEISEVVAVEEPVSFHSADSDPWYRQAPLNFQQDWISKGMANVSE